jgi:hypothetical protein
MGLGFSKTSETRRYPIFRSILEDIVGGITVKTASVPSAIKEIEAGCPVDQSSSTAGLYNLVKTGKLKANITSIATIMYLYPNTLFDANELITFDHAGASAASIVSITRAATTDTLLLKTALATILATNGVLYQANAAGGCAHKYTAEALLLDNITVRNSDLSTIPNVSAGAFVRGTVDESALTYPIPTADKTALTARIRFE